MGEADQVAWLARLSFEDPNQADSHPTQYLGQTVALSWLFKSTVTGWDYSLCTVGRNSVCPDLSVVSFSPFFNHNQIPNDQALQVPL